MTNHIPQAAQDVASAIREAARTIPQRGAQRVATHDGTILQMFWRCPPLFDGVVALLERGLFEESLFLGRSLFDESLQLQELAGRSATERVGLAVGRMKRSIKRNRGLMKTAVDFGVEKVLTHADANRRLDDWERKVDGYAKRHGAEPAAFEKPSDAARRFGRGEDYWTRELAHQMVHGNDAAMVYRRREAEPGTLLVANRTVDPKLVTGSMCFAGRSLVHSIRAAAVIFSWGGEATLDGLLDRLKALEPEP